MRQNSGLVKETILFLLCSTVRPHKKSIRKGKRRDFTLEVRAGHTSPGKQVYLKNSKSELNVFFPFAFILVLKEVIVLFLIYLSIF